VDETGNVTNVVGVDLDAAPAAGVPPASVERVKARLLAIAGLGIETHDHGDSVSVVWSAGLEGVGANTGLIVSHVYRAIRVTLDPANAMASGICREREAELELGIDAFVTGSWHTGQWVGGETVNVGCWLGPHGTSGAARATGVSFEFDWSQLRGPVIDAVTGAGWTYHPERD